MTVKVRDHFMNGMVLFLNGSPCQVIGFHSVHPDSLKGYKIAHIRNLANGQTFHYRFNERDDIELVPVVYKLLTFVRTENGQAIVTEKEKEVSIPLAMLTYGAHLLTKGIQVNVGYYNNNLLLAEMPLFIVGKIIETAPSIQNLPANNDLKPAIFENGAEVSVPLFIQVGDAVRIDTVSGKYVARVRNEA